MNISKNQTQPALQNALASARIEGFLVDRQTEEDCIRLLAGDVSIERIVQEILSRPATQRV